MNNNPLGYPDHRAFLGFSEELVYGMTETGAVRHVSQVERGLKCACRCPACDRLLIAKKGKVQIHHFAHHSGGVPCDRVAETNAHLWAKEVLESEKAITIPAVVVEHDGHREVIRNARVYRFASARLERRLDTIVPDVILETDDGTQLIVEVYVTHACDEIKIEKLRTENLSAIEIDLRQFRTSTDREAVERALLSTARREWLHNAKSGLFENRLRKRLDDERTRRAELARERERQAGLQQLERERARVAELNRQVDRLTRALRTHRRPAPADATRHENLPVHRQQLVGMDLQTIGFTVPDAVWQAELSRRYFEYPGALDYEVDDITVEAALRAVSEFTVLGFARILSPEVAARLAQVYPDKRLPEQAIDVFFDQAAGEGYLMSWQGGYRVAEWHIRSLERTEAELRAFQQCRERIQARIATLVAKLPAGETHRFDVAKWMVSPLPGLGWSPEKLCRSQYDALYRDFDTKLGLVEAMIKGGEPIIECLGLPLRGEIERAHIRKRDTAVKAAADRRKRLSNAAHDRLAEDADIWLGGTCEEDEELTRIDFAGGDAHAFGVMLGLLNMAAKVRDMKIREEAIVLGFQDQLRAKAASFFPPERAELFLNAYHPRLESTPIRHCRDARTLDHCLALLNGPKRRR